MTRYAKTQGFATGAAVLPNELNAKEDGTVADAELARALEQADLTRLGMAGNLKKFKLIDAKGSTLLGENVDYNGQNAGYAEQPWEIQNYVSKHDNQTFWDNNMYKVAEDASPEVRVKNADGGYRDCVTRSSNPVQPHGWRTTTLKIHAARFLRLW
ncbi:hypothetical protein QW180_20450 [Vibrio sinaloensis]|nr:hypothetical protein [Vibrio sinaloensis]